MVLARVSTMVTRLPTMVTRLPTMVEARLTHGMVGLRLGSMVEPRPMTSHHIMVSLRHLQTGGLCFGGKIGDEDTVKTSKVKDDDEVIWLKGTTDTETKIR